MLVYNQHSPGCLCHIHTFSFAMILKQSSLFLLASLVAVVPASADGLYTKNSPVLQVNQKNYDKLIARSNYASVRDPVAREQHG